MAQTIGAGLIGSGTLAAPDVAGTIGSGTIGSGSIGSPTAVVLDRSADRLQLTVLSPVVPSQPGTLRLSLGNGTPSKRVWLYLDGKAPTPVDLDELGGLGPIYLPVNGLTAGVHSVAASYLATAPVTDGDLVYTAKPFTTATAAITPDPAPPPVFPPPVTATRRWAFQSYGRNDAGTFELYVFPRNPDRMSRNFGELVITSEGVVNGGRVLTWEGAQKPLLWTWTGHVLTQDEFLELAHWGRENRRVYLTDHAGRRFLMAMADVKFERVRDVNRRWHHTYTMTGYALAGQGVLT